MIFSFDLKLTPEQTDSLIVAGLIDAISTLLDEVVRIEKMKAVTKLSGDAMQLHELENLKDAKRNLKHLEKTLRYFTSESEFAEIMTELFLEAKALT